MALFIPKDIASLVDDFDLSNNEFYFDRWTRMKNPTMTMFLTRDPAVFNLVLDFYRTGRLHGRKEERRIK